jgi:hypothetical protein
MTEGGASSGTGLAGRPVSLLPRAGGPAWPGTVQTWEVAADHVIARVDASADAVRTLDHHQVWLSTTNHTPGDDGITIFAGRAVAVAAGALELDGVVRLAAEPRRQAVRAAGCRVTLPPDLTGVQRTVAVVDLSRGGVRVPVDPTGWTYDDPLDLVLHLPGEPSLNVVGRLLRLDPAGSAVLALDDLPDGVAAAIDRFALTQLPPPSPPSSPRSK